VSGDNALVAVGRLPPLSYLPWKTNIFAKGSGQWEEDRQYAIVQTFRLLRISLA
jgi:hypothetical protein